MKLRRVCRKLTEPRNAEHSSDADPEDHFTVLEYDKYDRHIRTTHIYK